MHRCVLSLLDTHADQDQQLNGWNIGRLRLPPYSCPRSYSWRQITVLVIVATSFHKEYFFVLRNQLGAQVPHFHFHHVTSIHFLSVFWSIDRTFLSTASRTTF
jgi:hypothetical protein